MSFWGKIFGDHHSRYLKSLAPRVEEINGWEEKFVSLSPETLVAKTNEFRARLATGVSLDKLLPEAFALVREAARRTLGERHYDVQLLGGLVLHEGKIAEMKTGEGKTLVCTLPAYLNALTGRGVHVVTVNDYLARRDAVWMGQIYYALGLTVGVINHEAAYLYDPNHAEVDAARDVAGAYRVFHQFLKPCARREAYAADITYGTNNEYGFDYLRDHLTHDAGQVVQTTSPARTGYHFAIIDEVDSILVDEARTPLIISAPVAEPESLYGTFARIAAALERDRDYTVDEKTKSIGLTEVGIGRAEQQLGVDNIYTDRGIKYVHHLETAVRARALFERDRDYIVKDGEVIIVDEFTGRLQPGRRWSEGLHQAIEAKEGVRVQEESRTFASITFQNYFKLYEKVTGMTGTAMTSAEEFLRVYGLDTVAIPTHRSNARRDLNDLIYRTEAAKWRAITKRIKSLYERSQPVLVGTVSIEKNQILSAHLQVAGVPHRVLNAKNHEEEGQIIAEAGQRGQVTVATNMAGRGVDIKLGGAAASETEQAAIKELGGLFVLGTERHEARRIDNQLRGRAGRQGDPGATQFYLSLEDNLARVFAPERVKKMMETLGLPEDEPIEAKLVSRAIESAQAKIEGLNFDLRKHLLDYDNVLNHQRVTTYGRRQHILFGGALAVEEFLSKIGASPTVIAEKKQALGLENFIIEGQRLILQVIDLHWVEHLEAMEYMRGSVRLRAYGQRDPLVEYKREGLAAFRDMEGRVAEDVIRLLPHIGVQFKEETVALRAVHEGVNLITGGNNRPTSQKPLSVGAQTPQLKIGRNDPCPCGAINPQTGKVYKYKQCGLINAPHHKKTNPPPERIHKGHVL